MKRIKTISALLIALLLCLQMYIISFAGASMSVSSSNVKIGDSVTVTVTVSGSNIAGVQFNINYDSSILTYKSCSGGSFGGGKVMWYDESGSVSSHSVSITFTANKTGKAYVSTSGMLVSDSDANPKSGFSDQGASITVSSAETTTKAPETTTKAPETTTKKQETTTRKEETTTETTTEAKNNEIVLNNKKYTLVDDSAFVDAPDGFDETYSDYKGEKILTYTSKDKSQQIVCLEDEDGKKIFALFDDEKDSFSEYIKLKSASLPLILIAPKAGMIPSSYNPVNIKINDKEVAAYQNEEFKAKGLHLIYALNLSNGQAGLYVYDSNDKTIQRYYGLSVVEQESETTTEPTTQESTTDSVPLEKETMIKLICALGVLLLAALIAIVTLAIKLKKKGENNDDVDFRIIEEDVDSNNYYNE